MFSGIVLVTDPDACGALEVLANESKQVRGNRSFPSAWAEITVETDPRGRSRVNAHDSPTSWRSRLGRHS